MRKKKQPDLLMIIALFVGFGLIATAVSKEVRQEKPDVVSMDQTRAAIATTPPWRAR